MEKPNPAQVEVARRWLAGADQGQGTQDRAAAAELACERLSLHLAPLIGTAGVEMLVVRSLRLTLPGAAGAGGQDGRAAARLRECLQAQDPAAAAESAVAFFATFFALLATLIGDRLTEQVLAQAVPQPGEAMTAGPSERKS